MINYEIDPRVLSPFIPAGTEIDLWEDKAYISLVGFMFLDTRVQGMSIPFHRNFEEVNLRFYVKRHSSKDGIRRGVSFIKEIVPRWAIAKVARVLFNENYVSLPMRHFFDKQSEENQVVEYEWKFNEKWQTIRAGVQSAPQYPPEGSQEEFIAEHYWGYVALSNGDALEYQVDHPTWRIWDVDSYKIDVDMKNLYGASFAHYLDKEPASVFLAEGSEVKVFKGTVL